MKRGSVWLIDDEKDFGEIYGEQLLPYFDFRCFTSSSDALNELRSNRAEAHKLPDVIVCDLTMPGKSGYQVVDEIRNNNLPIEVIVISGHLGREQLHQLSALKICGALEKPFDGATLVGAVNRAYLASCNTKDLTRLRELWEARSELLYNLSNHKLAPNEIAKYLSAFQQNHLSIYELNIRNSK